MSNALSLSTTETFKTLNLSQEFIFLLFALKEDVNQQIKSVKYSNALGYTLRLFKVKSEMLTIYNIK